MSLDLSGSSGFFIRHKRWQSIQHRWGGTSSKGLGCPATLNVGIWVSASLKNGRVCGSVCLTHWASFERTKSGAQGLRRAGNIVVMLGIVPGGWPSRLGLSQAPTSQAPETSTTLPFSPVGESMPCSGHARALAPPMHVVSGSKGVLGFTSLSCGANWRPPKACKSVCQYAFDTGSSCSLTLLVDEEDLTVCHCHVPPSSECLTDDRALVARSPPG